MFTFKCISCAINVIYEVIKHKLPPGFLERSTLFYLYFYCVFSVFIVFSFTVTLCLETTCFCFMDHDDLPPPSMQSLLTCSLSRSLAFSLSRSPFLRWQVWWWTRMARPTTCCRARGMRRWSFRGWCRAAEEGRTAPRANRKLSIKHSKQERCGGGTHYRKYFYCMAGCVRERESCTTL